MFYAFGIFLAHIAVIFYILSEWNFFGLLDDKPKKEVEETESNKSLVRSVDEIMRDYQDTPIKSPLA